MALEPQIALGVQAPVLQDPIEEQAKIEGVKALADQRQALAEQRQQQAQALIAKAKSQAAINAALQQSGGDLRGAGDILTQTGNGIEGQNLYAQHTAQAEKLAQATEATTKSHAAQLDLAERILGSIDPAHPEQYGPAVKAFKATLDPGDRQQVDQIAPDNPNPQDIPGIIDRLNKMQVGAKALFDQHSKYVEGFLKGDYNSNLAGVLAITPVQDRPAALKMLTAQVPDYQTAMTLQQQFLPLLNAKPEDIWQAGMTVEQRNQAAERKATADREAAKATTKSVLLDGKPAEVRVNAQGQFIDDAGAVIQSSRVKPIPPASASAGAGATPNDPKDIAAAIIRGEQPPVLTGMYRDAAPIRAELARQGYPLAKATEDWTATQKYLATLNGQQQTRLRQAIDFTGSSLDLVEDLSKQWDAGGFPILNSAQLSLAKNGAMGPKAQQIATKLSAQIADLTSELGTVYKGGNSSTDESLKLAAKNLSENWSKDTLLANVDQIRKNLAIRQNSMTLAGGAAGVNKGNPYTPPTAQASPTAPAAKTPATGAVPPKGAAVGDTWMSPTGLRVWNGQKWTVGG